MTIKHFVISCLLCVPFLHAGSACAQNTFAFDQYSKAGLEAFRSGDYSKSVELFSQAVAEAELFGADNPSLCQGVHYLSSAYLRLGKLKDAEKSAKRALEIAEKLYGSNNIKVASCLDTLGWVYELSGDYQAAESMYKRSIEIVQKTYSSNHLAVATEYNSLGALYVRMKQYAAAETLIKRAIEVDKAIGADQAMATHLGNLALCYRQQWRLKEAESMLKESLALEEKFKGPNHPEVANTLVGLAQIYIETREFDKAENLLSRALTIQEATFGSDHPNPAFTCKIIAELRVGEKKYSDAEKLFKRALAIEEKYLGKQDDETKDCRLKYAALLRKTNRSSEASKLEAVGN